MQAGARSMAKHIQGGMKEKKLVLWLWVQPRVTVPPSAVALWSFRAFLAEGRDPFHCPVRQR